MASQPHSLSYVGCNFLRQRLVLSTLSGRPVKIRKIRAKEENPGLRGSGRLAWAREGVHGGGMQRGWAGEEGFFREWGAWGGAMIWGRVGRVCVMETI